jgi:hypothetical protein
MTWPVNLKYYAGVSGDKLILFENQLPGKRTRGPKWSINETMQKEVLK